MSDSAHGSGKLAYSVTLLMLGLALAFPIGLMVFNPTLMFERGWEQYVGTGIYFWAVLTLTRELLGLWRNERAFEQSPALLTAISAAADRVPAMAAAPPAPRSKAIAADDARILPVRVRQMVAYLEGTKRIPTVTQVMELNREASGLDQEHMAGRFTLTRYILYLLPVIGFIGTVEGISKALMNISKVLPMVKELDGFMSNLTGVTSALQIAFDSTLLALFLSAALMLVQTLVFRRSENLLARVDRWVVENVLPRVGVSDPLAAGIVEALGPQLAQLRQDLAAAIEPAARAFELQADRWASGLAQHVERFGTSVDQLPDAFAGFQRGASAIAQAGLDLSAVAATGESVRRGVAHLARIETALSQSEADPAIRHLEEIKHGVERTTAAIETLSNSWAQAYERSSRATQDQLARTLGSLKDALDLINVSMEQGNALYRSIVKTKFQVYREDAS
jgi:biopolymer transport protein ExbB/TolQ